MVADGCGVERSRTDLVTQDREFDLCFSALLSGLLGLTKANGTTLAEAASYCLHKNQHPNPVSLRIDGDNEMTCHLKWEVITPEYHNTYADLVEAANFGAAAVGMLMARKFVGERMFVRSVIGTGCDYWLGDSDSRGIFQVHARLEVSGILKGSETLIRARVKQKLRQTGRSEMALQCPLLLRW